MRDVTDIIQEFYNINKYLITIKGLDNNWIIYFYQNKHINLEITTENGSTSRNINIDEVKDIIADENNIKLLYITCYNDYKIYTETITKLIIEFNDHYKNKKINIKHEIGYA